MDRPEARAYYDLDDLAMWQTQVGAVPLEDALNPTGAFFVSPDAYLVASDSSLIAGIGHPGQLFACARATGRMLWNLSADACRGVAYADGTLAWLTEGELSVVNPFDGAPLWSRPLDSSGSSCHPLLEIAHGRVFVGSSNGRLHALDASDGAQLWSQQVVPPHAFPEGYLDIGDGKRLWLESSPEPSIIETRPAVLDGRIVVGTYAKSVVAYHTETGRRAWQWQLDGPALHAVLPFGPNVVLHTENRVYCLRAMDGWVLWQWHFPDEAIQESFACSEGTVYVTTGTADRYVSERTDRSSKSSTMAVDAGGPRLLRVSWAWPSQLHWEPATGWLYEMGPEALSIIDPQTGDRLHHIDLAGHGHQLAMAVTAKAIYLLGQSFSKTVTTSLYALRHP